MTLRGVLAAGVINLEQRGLFLIGWQELRGKGNRYETMEVKAPNNYQDEPRPWIFLAGSIEMGAAENWQEIVANKLMSVTILNPRRDDWDSRWVTSINNTQFREQVEWEIMAQEQADIILFHFDPNTKSPITLLELGLFRKKAVVHCPDGYWKKGNIEVVCHHYNVPMVETIDDMINEAIRRFP